MQQIAGEFVRNIGEPKCMCGRCINLLQCRNILAVLLRKWSTFPSLGLAWKCCLKASHPNPGSLLIRQIKHFNYSVV